MLIIHSLIINCFFFQDFNSDLEDYEYTANEISYTDNHVVIPFVFWDLIMGRYGKQRGTGNGSGVGKYNAGAGVTYTRWGRTTCPSTRGTELVYVGTAGGSHYSHHGGGANYLCLPNDPKYLSTRDATGSNLYGAEYQNPVAVDFSAKHDHNVPCSVCYIRRSTKLMIPAAIACPKYWTEEYNGYLMAGYHGHQHNYMFECVDKDAEVIDGSQGNTDGALFYHVISACGAGQKCPPFLAKKPIACVVCTK